MYRLGDLCSQLVRRRLASELHRASICARNRSPRSESWPNTGPLKQTREFHFDCPLDEWTLSASQWQSFEYEPLNVQVDVHAVATLSSCQLKSSLLNGRLSFRNSLRAAWRTSDIVTAEPV